MSNTANQRARASGKPPHEMIGHYLPIPASPLVTPDRASTMYQTVDTFIDMNSSSILSLPISFILVLLGSITLIVGIPVVLVGLSVWVSTRRASKRSPADDISNAAVRQARTGRIGGLIAGAVIGVLTYFVTNGILVPAFVAAGYLLGMLVFELRPSGQPTGPIRVASLQARNAWQYLPKRAIRSTVVVASLALLGSVVFTVIPPPSAFGRGQIAGLIVPFAVMAAGALAAWFPLMGKVARLPQPVGNESGRIATSRANAARAITGAVLGIELLSLASVISASRAFIDPVGEGTASIVVSVLIGLGVGLSIAGLVVWSILSRWRSVPVEPADPAPAEPRVA